jgi:hypothetical protein
MVVSLQQTYQRLAYLIMVVSLQQTYQRLVYLIMVVSLQQAYQRLACTLTSDMFVVKKQP